MVSKLTNEMIIDLLKNRDRLIYPVLTNREIYEDFKKLASRPTVERKLRLLENTKRVEYRQCIGNVSLYWLPGEKMTKGRKFSLGWE